MKKTDKRKSIFLESVKNNGETKTKKINICNIHETFYHGQSPVWSEKMSYAKPVKMFWSLIWTCLLMFFVCQGKYFLLKKRL